MLWLADAQFKDKAREKQRQKLLAQRALQRKVRSILFWPVFTLHLGTCSLLYSEDREVFH
jgi:hypothetical protein